MVQRLVWCGMVCGLVMALALPVGYDAGAQADEIGTFEPVPCWMELPPPAVDGEDIVCGYVTVPESHADPAGPTIRLAVAVLPAVRDDPMPDPVVFEAGGPGMSSLISTAGLLLAHEGLFPERDLVLIEQRGIPGSEPGLICDAGRELLRSTYGQDIDAATMRAQEAEVLDACYREYQAMGTNLSAYNSQEIVADFPLVWDALGYQQVNFFGVSYSSLLAQYLARDYPDRLRTVILDSVVPLDVDFALRVPNTADAAFRTFFQSCAGDPACDAAFPDLETVFFQLVDDYNAAPRSVEIPLPFEAGNTVMATINGDYLVLAAYQQFYNGQLVPLLPASIYALRDGDDSFIRDYVHPTLFGMRTYSGLYNSVICSEYGTYDASAVQLAGVYPQVAGAMVLFADYAHACAAWPVDVLPPEFHRPMTSDVPALLLSGRFDPITPPAYGQQAASYFTTAYAYTFPTAGHSVLGSPCSVDILVEFVNDPTRAPDSRCLDNVQLSFMVPSVTVDLVPFEAADGSFRAVRPVSWIEVAPGIFIGGESPTSQSMLELAHLPETPLSAQKIGWAAYFGLSEFPAPTGTTTVNGVTWELYTFEGTAVGVGPVRADVGVAYTEGGNFYVGLYATPDRYDDLHAQVFLPALEAFALAD
ncbi:MAG: alpha/beta hydrolase [Chloroflexi bacterium]|nr:alpha/beta hydrolase [Chloroflexota bacterium]